MAFNIKDFATNIATGGTLRTNRFEVEIDNPALIQTYPEYNQLGRILKFRIEQAKIPGLTFEMKDVKRYGVGPRQDFATNVGFSKISFNFIEMSQNDIFKYFYKWLNGIYDFNGPTAGNGPTYESEYKKYYQTDIRVKVYKDTGELITTVVFKEAFPSSMSETNLSWTENNQLYKLNVTFSFTEWYVENAVLSANPGQGLSETDRRVTPVNLPSPVVSGIMNSDLAQGAAQGAAAGIRAVLDPFGTARSIIGR